MPQLPAARPAYQGLAAAQVVAQQRPVAAQRLAAQIADQQRPVAAQWLAAAAQAPVAYRQLQAALPSWAQGPERAQLPGPA